MSRLKLLLFAVFSLLGCGYPDALEGFSPVETWAISDKVTIESEIPGLDRAQVASNLDTAFRMIEERNKTKYKLEWWGALRVRIWNRQILFCDQWFIGACVHPLKGMEEGDSTGYIVNLNNGGELLAHELLHMIEHPSNPDHQLWKSRGWTSIDYEFRRKVGLFK